MAQSVNPSISGDIAKVQRHEINARDHEHVYQKEMPPIHHKGSLYITKSYESKLATSTIIQLLFPNYI